MPAMVLTHGCSGITGAETYWGSSLRQLGVATFVVNSFVGRSIPRVCAGPHTISMASVLTDVYRARDLLAAHPRIDPDKIAVMGFSFGGRTALWASQLRFQQRYDRGPSRFAAHLAFYPTNCHIRLADEDRVSDAPIRIFHGAADDATVIGRCREYVARLRDAGKDVTLLEYADAKHWADLPTSEFLPARISHPQLKARPLHWFGVGYLWRPRSLTRAYPCERPAGALCKYVGDWGPGVVARFDRDPGRKKGRCSIVAIGVTGIASEGCAHSGVSESERG